jgi:hypothetical protein
MIVIWKWIIIIFFNFLKFIFNVITFKKVKNIIKKNQSMVLFPSLDLSLAHTAKEPKVVWCYISWMVWLNCCERDGNQFLGFAWCFNPASPRTWVMYLNKQFKVTKIRIYKINKKWFKFEKKIYFLEDNYFCHSYPLFFYLDKKNIFFY